MNKHLFTFLFAFLPLMAMGQTNQGEVIAEADYTTATEFNGWCQFADSQTDAKVELGDEGLEIIVGTQTGELWQPQVMVIPDGSFNLEEDGKYIVVITAKFPTAGTLQISMGSWSANDQATFDIEASDDYQTIECVFDCWPVTADGAHLLFQCGDFKGTTILKKIQVVDMSDPPILCDNIFYRLNAKDKTAKVHSNPQKYHGEVTIPSTIMYEREEYTVTSIGSHAFYNCSGLTSVAIPNSVTSIGYYAFSGCSSLTSVTIPNSVKSIGYYAFRGCSSLTSISVESGNTKYDSRDNCNGIIETQSNTLITGCQNTIIPSNVTTIDDSAFYGCSGLTSVTIPNCVTSIGYEAFYNCSGLTSLTISNSVTSIGENAFYNCSGLTSITIPNSVTSIGWSAFSGCSSLTSLTIPNSVTSIGSSAFSGCSGLTSLTIPNSVTSIGSSAFYNCNGLTSITIPSSVTSIGSSAFSGCSGLTSVIIGKNISSIDFNSFGYCPNLTDVYCLAENVPSTDANAFMYTHIEDVTLHVPTTSLNSYSKTEPWKSFKNLVTLSGEDVPKCAKPEISFENGKIKFTCETKDVIFISEVKLADDNDYYDSEIQLSQKYKISVYATKAGCLDSDVATREIVINGKDIVVGDVDGNGVVNEADHEELSKIIMAQ